MARELAVWFQRSFGNNRKLDPGPFIPPPEPKKADATLHGELQHLRDEVTSRQRELEAAQRAIEEAKRAAEAELAERLNAQQRAEKAREDAAIWEALAAEPRSGVPPRRLPRGAALSRRVRRAARRLAASDPGFLGAFAGPPATR